MNRARNRRAATVAAALLAFNEANKLKDIYNLDAVKVHLPLIIRLVFTNSRIHISVRADRLFVSVLLYLSFLLLQLPFYSASTANHKILAAFRITKLFSTTAHDRTILFYLSFTMTRSYIYYIACPSQFKARIE
jgi:hypothetical protein